MTLSDTPRPADPATEAGLDLAALAHSYTAEPIPPCRICGGPLSLARAGGGRDTVWACSTQEDSLAYKPGRTFSDEHYRESLWTATLMGDARVLELIRCYQELLAQTTAKNVPGLSAPAETPRWHAPGLGEVHSSCHSYLIFCERAENPEEDAPVVSDALAHHVCALLNQAEPFVEDGAGHASPG
jgi:hypothetical protein